MEKFIGFAKVAGKWFADLEEYEGDINDLQMVSGADTFLETINRLSGNTKYITIGILEDDDIVLPGATVVTLKKVRYEYLGAVYTVEGYEYYRDTIWLCPVCKWYFGEYPSVINIVIY